MKTVAIIGAVLLRQRGAHPWDTRGPAPGITLGAADTMLAAPGALRKQSVFELAATMMLVFSHGSGFFWQAPGSLIRAQGSRTRCIVVQ
ncbi:MAG: hypothetical protein ACO1OK_07885 [Devosia sp.]